MAAPGWCPVILNARGEVVVEMSCDATGWGPERNTDELGGLTYLANLEVGDADLDGDPDVVAGMSALNYGVSVGLSRWVPYQDHLVGVWDARSGEALDAWPRVIEDISMFVRPAIADLNGDDVPEIIMSSGGYGIHAWTADGEEAAGWPRFTGGWIYSAIRVGDVSGDGEPEVVAVTREGHLFAWHGQPSAALARPEERRQPLDTPELVPCTGGVPCSAEGCRPYHAAQQRR